MATWMICDGHDNEISSGYSTDEVAIKAARLHAETSGMTTYVCEAGANPSCTQYAVDPHGTVAEIVEEFDTGLVRELDASLLG